MGPLIYAGDGGAFTDFHVDGYGTVDAGHLCLHGYNEVIMLRKLHELSEFEDAAKILGLSMQGLNFYRDKVFTWPTNDVIKELEKCG